MPSPLIRPPSYPLDTGRSVVTFLFSPWLLTSWKTGITALEVDAQRYFQGMYGLENGSDLPFHSWAGVSIATRSRARQVS